jgi:hypothetical protein
MAREQAQQGCDVRVTNVAPAQDPRQQQQQPQGPSSTVVRNPAPDAAPPAGSSTIYGTYKISR